MCGILHLLAVRDCFSVRAVDGWGRGQSSTSGTHLTCLTLLLGHQLTFVAHRYGLFSFADVTVRPCSVFTSSPLYFCVFKCEFVDAHVLVYRKEGFILKTVYAGGKIALWGRERCSSHPHCHPLHPSNEHITEPRLSAQPTATVMHSISQLQLRAYLLQLLKPQRFLCHEIFLLQQKQRFTKSLHFYSTVRFNCQQLHLKIESKAGTFIPSHYSTDRKRHEQKLTLAASLRLDLEFVA
ncbi:uncharacterized protein V6R79_021146 [Siganus canaliculatus]